MVTPTSPLTSVVLIPTTVETPLRVDAGSTTIGVSVVAVVLPVGVSVTTTTLVTTEPERVATVPTPEAVCLLDVVVDRPPEYSVCPHAVERPVVTEVETPVTVPVVTLYPAALPTSVI